MSIVLKAESRPKHKENFFGGVFYKNKKRTFSGVQNGTFKKSIFKFVFLRFVLYGKRKLRNNFYQKILIFEPPGIFENENFDARAWNWTSKIIPDLDLLT